jgi:hypothetical protein
VGRAGVRVAAVVAGQAGGGKLLARRKSSRSSRSSRYFPTGCEVDKVDAMAAIQKFCALAAFPGGALAKVNGGTSGPSVS